MARSPQRATAETFIRFVVGTDGDDADGLDGLFVESELLSNEERLAAYETDRLDQICFWFNTELPCPPFSRRRFPAAAVSWFRSSATRFITRMWDLAAILREHGRPVRLLKTDDPGAVIYEDSYQIVAEPWRGRRQRLRRPSNWYETNLSMRR